MLMTLPDPGGNGGSGEVGLVTAIKLPDPGGNGGSGDVGFVTVEASPNAEAKQAKVAIRTAVRILTKRANIEGDLLAFKKKLSW